MVYDHIIFYILRSTVYISIICSVNIIFLMSFLLDIFLIRAFSQSIFWFSITISNLDFAKLP